MSLNYSKRIKSSFLELRNILCLIFLRVKQPRTWDSGQDTLLKILKTVENSFILCSACVDLWRCLQDTDLVLLVDSNSWRGSAKNSGQLTWSIYSKIVQNVMITLTPLIVFKYLEIYCTLKFNIIFQTY